MGNTFFVKEKFCQFKKNNALYCVIRDSCKQSGDKKEIEMQLPLFSKHRAVLRNAPEISFIRKWQKNR